ncbi:MAG: hypothetical protein LQ341_005707 [Variospora aurantia]|nr:MAG: hypothetical protein LQ341_005707 [Variospora aurantia]
MTTTMSKRTQVRNERALQELVKTVPGNDRCADCGARNPGWASWSLGVFLCMRCASLHRKLGTHISKVKSLSMDSWTNEQVASMQRNGNAASNRIYNPRNSKPAIPLDVDEVDAALERFIRQKYDQQAFSGAGTVRPAARQDTGTSGSTRSSDDQPPPLPPKPGKRFGFSLRSVSSALPTTKNSHISPPTSPDTANGYPPSPPIRMNKQSRIFGTSVGGGGENMETKLAILRDMGFADEKRNSAILKGLNANLERTIETLVRLGDGNAPGSRPRSPIRSKQAAASQPFSSVGVEPPHVGSGISIHPLDSTEPKTEAAASTSIPTTRSQTGPNFTEARPYNPFEVPNPRSDRWPLEKDFENLQVSRPQPQSQPQPLFPNATGGYPIQPDHIQASRFQQSMTPPAPQLHQHVHSNPYFQQMNAINSSSNPFFQTSNQAMHHPGSLYSATNQPETNGNAYNPFMAAQPYPRTYTTGNVLQPPQAFSLQPSPDAQQPFMTNRDQYLSMQNQQQPDQFTAQGVPTHQAPLPYQQFPAWSQSQPQPLQAQPTGRFDKSSILALYNYPQLAPPPLPQGSSPSENQIPVAAAPPLPPSAARSTSRAPGQRSVTMPTQLAAGSRNPFLTMTTAQANNVAVSSNSAVPAIPSGLSRHVSQESVGVGSFQSGRHSPDAFASLSARFVR